MSIWQIIGLLALVLVLAPVAFYLVSPRAAYRVLQGMIRRRGRLTLKHVTVGGTRWPYLEGGPKGQVPVVLVHGFGGDKDNWSLYAKELTDKHHVIAMDLPGFGENDRSMALDHSMDAQTDRILAFLDALKIQTCHLGGNSMGGYLTLLFALKYPERLASITLFNNAGVQGANKSELEGQAEDGENPLVPQNLAEMRKMLGFIAYKPMKAPNGLLKVFLSDIQAHNQTLDTIFWTLVNGIQENPLNDAIRNIKLPCLIIWGRHDKLIDVSCVDVLQNGIAGSEAVILEETGHVPMIEQPVQTAQHHRRFLAKL